MNQPLRQTQALLDTAQPTATPPAATAQKTQIVVVGGGAGGLELVTRLGRTFGREAFDIILLERNSTHIWKPLLHEVAAGSLDANLDEVGYRGHGHVNKYRFFLGTLKDIDRDNGQVVVAPILDENGDEIMGEHRIRYDYLVIAVGSVANDFGVDGVADHCLFLESRGEADRFRQKLLNQCLRVSRTMMFAPGVEQDVEIAIVGGGATGVELSSELYNAASALKHYGLEVFDEKRLKVTLLEAGPRILPALPEHVSQAAQAQLEALGVHVQTNAQVVKVTDQAMHLKDGTVVPAALKVWAAGVKAPAFLKGIAGLETGRNNQLVVQPTLQATRDEHIFAIGDCACFIPDGADRPIPPRAQAAHQMAETVFKNIRAMINGKKLKPFVYQDRGSLVSLSRFSTLGMLMGNLMGKGMSVEGRAARFMYVSLYQMHLIAIHGWLRGVFTIVVSHFTRVVRPKLKFH
ncbi:MAG: NAD(P)/FAD-dependent oxidoreductase [Sphingomonadales bacterium]